MRAMGKDLVPPRLLPVCAIGLLLVILGSGTVLAAAPVEAEDLLPRYEHYRW